MKVYEAKYSWMPAPSKVPQKVKKALLPFTPMKWGWAIWYHGKTRSVCGKTVELAEVADRWAEMKAVLDSQVAGASKMPDRRTLREALSAYFTWLDYRVKTGKPAPLAAVTAEGYKLILLALGKFEIDGRKFADMPLADFGPEPFKRYAEHLSHRAPSSLSRIVASTHSFFNYCRDEGYIASPPNYGRYFVRAPIGQIRDRRIGQQKAWEPKDLRLIVQHAGVQEKAWIGLALCGAMDNADISHLTFELFDQTGMILDYRRRKTGLMPRLIPIHPMARQWLDAYLEVRPQPADPASKDLVFLTPTGLPLQRLLKAKTGIGYQADYIKDCWDPLLRRAGLRRKVTFKWVCRVCGKVRPTQRAKCCGQPKDAQVIFERAYALAKPEDIKGASESIARCMKAEDGTVGRANAWAASIRPPTTEKAK